MKININELNNQIQQSKQGVFYAPPQRLETKKRVYSQAILQKIPHDTAEKIDICLKIGRYNILDQVETENPKSELTLNDEEFRSLVTYIEKYYKPLELEVEKFIPIESDQAAFLLKQFKALVGTDDEIAKKLIESGILSDNISVAVETIKRKQAIDNFKIELNNNQAESFWQDWFSKNKWFIGSDFIKILDERQIDTSNIADYLMQAYDGFLDIVEIKKPNGLKFWADSLDHNNYIPSSDLIKAITQCQNYLYQIERESNSVKFLEKTGGTKIIKPRCLLVFGRSNNWDEQQQNAYRILNSSYNQINIMTYDHLLIRAMNLLGVNNENMVDDSEECPF